MTASDSYRTALRSFAALVEPAHEDASIDLAGAALAIARTEYPDLDIPYYVARLEALARRVRGRMRNNPTAREVIALLNRELFDEEGLRGNRDDYYDPRNSFLSDVIAQRLRDPKKNAQLLRVTHMGESFDRLLTTRQIRKSRRGPPM